MVAAITMLMPVPASANDEPILVYSADLASDSEKTQLVLHLDGKPDHRSFFMDNPERFVLELERTVFAIGEEGKPDPVGLFKDIRYGRISPEKSRFVADLSRPAKTTSIAVSENGKGRYLLSIELVSVERAEFSKAVDEQKQIYGSSGDAVMKGARVRPPPKQAGRFRIVLDPGHGGIDGGAAGRKAVEKDIVLKVARKIGEAIEERGPFDVYYTRETDVFVALYERQAFAQRHKADLFISVHADSLRQKHVRGATVYTLGKRASDGLAQQIENSENFSDAIGGLAVPESREDVTGILAELTLRETNVFSKGFSSRLVDHLSEKFTLINNPERSAAFRVLKNAEIPGVLLELGYLSNREDEQLLMDSDWQTRIAGTVADAVADFFAPRLPIAEGQ